jgi:sec-independent protein translocase protein TatA
MRFQVWHFVVLVLVFLLLFGAKRLPDLARGVGRSLRIIKAETRSLVDDDDLATKAEPKSGREPLVISDDEASPITDPARSRDK